MRKKIVIKKKKINPDPRYSSILVQKLINKLMWDGKLRKAQKIVYEAASLIEKEFENVSFSEVLSSAIENIKPGIELRTRKVGGGRQRTILKITPERDITLALKMIKNAARENKSIKPFYQILAEEIKGSWKKNSNSWKKKENLWKEAESSRISSVY